MDEIRPAINTATAEEYKYLLDNIPVGQRQAISMKLLADSCGVDVAGIKEIVLHARIDGCFIISGQHGYFLPETLDELQTYFRQRKTVIKTASKAIRHFGAELRRIDRKEGCG